jgi:transposase
MEFVETMQQYDAANLVFLDECGVNTNMVRGNGRALRGSRASGRRPANRGKNVTVIGAVGLSLGLAAVRTYEGAMNAVTFLAWLDHALIPCLKPGNVVVLDNLRVHHVTGVRERLEAAGCTVSHLPPYSPDLNPIEMAWSKLKTYLRGRAERQTERVRRAVHRGARKIGHRDIRGGSDTPAGNEARLK